MSRQAKSLVLAAIAVCADIVVVYAAAARGMSEPVSLLKFSFALFVQVLIVLGVPAFIHYPTTSEPPLLDGPFERFRLAMYPYLVFGIVLAFSESLLYNAVACGSQPFVHTTRGEPLCR